MLTLRKALDIQAKRHEHDEEIAMLLIGMAFIEMAAKDPVELMTFAEWRN